MKVMVTGASSPIGRAVTAALRPDHEVIAVVGPRRTPNADDERRVDLADAHPFIDLLLTERPEAVIHLASVTGAACGKDPALARSVNVDATRALADTASMAGVRRIVFASSAAVYGDRRNKALVETDAPDPRSLYGETKLEAEQVLAEAAVAGDVDVATYRIFNVYGAGLDSSLVNRLSAVDADHRIELHGPDDFIRDYVDVRDVATSLRSSISLQLPARQVLVNLGSGVPTSNARLLRLLDASSRSGVRIVPAPASFSWADVTRFRRFHGFVPSDLAVTSTREGA